MDEPSTSYTMRGAREAIAGGVTHIEEQVKGIEHAVFKNPGLAFDLAKTLIESMCRSVLSERSIAHREEDDLPALFKIVTNNLSFLPPTISGEAKVRASLKRTLNGLNTSVQGICELRNQCGFASHGAGIPRPEMETTQALLAAETADTIIGFLFRVHNKDRIVRISPHFVYEDHPDFNNSIDESQGMIRIFDVEFRPSEVLYQMEPETYRVYLAEFKAEKESAEAEKNPTDAAEGKV